MTVYKRIALALMSVVLVSTLVPAPALAAPLEAGKTIGASTVTAQASAKAHAGWVRTKSGKKYYRHGKAVVGLQLIKGNYYYFSTTGTMRTRDIKLGSVSFYIEPNGKVIGARDGTKYYYRTLKRMTSNDAYNFATYLMARKVVNATSSSSDPKKTRMRKAFDWAARRPYRGQSHDTSDPKWIARAARSQFNGKGGNCVSFAASLAYMLTYIGYDADICSSFKNCEGHAWTMVGRLVYDACHATKRGYRKSYGAPMSAGGYIGPGSRFDVPLFNPKNASRKATVPKALLKAGFASSGGKLVYYEKGKAVRNAWRTIAGKRYYFKSNGKAATGSTKVKGTYYVFDERGTLQASPSQGLHTVVVANATYRVDKAGRAVGGWSDDRTRRFAGNGKLLCGVQVVDGAFYAATAQGTYLPETTAQLVEASRTGAPASTLRTLLDTWAGKPKQVAYSISCMIAGEDGVWDYGAFCVLTARPTRGIETVSSVEAI